MIQHVYEAVRGARRLDRVIVATDDERIASAVRGFGEYHRTLFRLIHNAVPCATERLRPCS